MDCICEILKNDPDYLSEQDCDFRCYSATIKQMCNHLRRFPGDQVVMRKIIKLRHNFAGLCFCLDNNISIDKFDQDLGKYRNTMGKTLTPDVILTNGAELTVIDFAVSRDPNLVKMNKTLKYNPFLNKEDKFEIVLFDLQTCLWDISECFKIGSHCWVFTELMEETMEYWKYFSCEEYYECSPLPMPPINQDRAGFIEMEMDYELGDNLKEHCSSPDFGEELFECLEEYHENWRVYLVYDSALGKIKSSKSFPAGATNFHSQGNLNLRKREWIDMYLRTPNIFYKKVMISSFDSKNIDSRLFECDDFPDLPGHATLVFPSSPGRINCLKKFSKRETIKELITVGCKRIKEDGMLSSKVLSPEKVKTFARDFRKKMVATWFEKGSVRMRQLFMYPVPAAEKLVNVGRKQRRVLIPGEPKSKFLRILKGKELIFEYTEKTEDDRINDKEFEVYRRLRFERNKVREELSWEEKKVANKWMEEYCALRGVTREERKLFWLGKECPTPGTYKFRESCLRILECKVKSKFHKMARGRKNTIKLNRSELRVLQEEMDSITDYNKTGNETVGTFWFDGNEISFEQLCKKMDLILDYLFSDGFDVNSTYISSYTYQSKDFLEKQKEVTYTKYAILAEKLGSKCLMKVAEFISKICYSLFCMSLYNTRKGCVCYDCMDYENAILFVAGQKSHLGKNDSKPFKFIIPTNSLLNEIVGYSGTRGEILFEGENTYYASNWRFLKMEQVKYGIELPTRIQQIFICTSLQYPEIHLDHVTNKFKALLMLNNRRKNEEFLHDIKYLTYNILGILGCYDELLEDKFTLPHDHLTRYIEEKFLSGIEMYVDSAVENGLFDQKLSNDYTSVKLQHPLSDRSEGMDVFDCWVYSSHCMCKAAFTQRNERWKNLKGIISVHEKARQVIKESYNEKQICAETDKPIGEVFGHDLYFNSDVVTLCSHHLKTYLIKSGSIPILSKEWQKICDSDISSYANSSGLRKNDLSNKGSWGQKGHQVLLDFMGENISALKGKIELFEEMDGVDPKSPTEFKRTKEKLCSTRFTVREACEKIPLTIPQFSMADKKQWGGNREIYIMTHNLKNIQWCLEQMFAAICRTLPNELISVPSNKRMKIFYDSIKQKTTAKRYYGVFDCRKWAPLSNLAKYRIFVNGLEGVLPDSFIETFNNFWDRYYKKKLFVKGADLEFLDFEGQETILNYFRIEKLGEKTPEEGRTARMKQERGFEKSRRSRRICPDTIYSLEMNYSFMMGIFNYLSSLLHSSVQMFYVNEIVPAMNEKLDCTMKVQLWAHSDDSGGIFDLHSFSEKKEQNDLIMRKYLAVYEVLQKSCNHMFSLKKCTVTYSYFEIISNIMIYGDIVPITTKFMNSHQLNLTTQGPVSDIKSLSSQAIEMISNGSCFEAAYVKLICLNNLYFRFLYNTKPLQFHRKLPIECGGVNDEHPGLQLMFSSSSQFCRLKRENLDLLLSQYTELSALLGKETTDPIFPTPKFIFRYKAGKEREEYKIFDRVMKTIPENNVDCLPGNNFIFYVARMKSLNEKQALEYSMDDIRGIEIMESYVSPRNYPLCLTKSGPVSIREFFKVFPPIFSVCSCSSFEENAMDAIEYSTMQAEGFYQVVDKYNSQILNLNFVETMTRTKPLEFHMSNLLLTNNSVYKNRNVVKFVTDKRYCIMDGDYNTYDNLRKSGATELEIKRAILMVESGKLVENFYMVCPCRLPNGVNSFNEFVQFCVEVNTAQCMPTIQIVYSMFSGFGTKYHAENFSANCVAKAYSRLRIGDSKSELIVDGEKAETWLIRNIEDVTEGKQAFITIGRITQFEIMSNSNWICYIGGKQAKLDAAWWRGKTTAYCHSNGKLYVLKITNHTIEHILCPETVQRLEEIREDIELMQGYSLSFRMQRSAKKPFVKSFGSKFGSGYILDEKGTSIDYIQNVQPVKLELSQINFVLRGNSMFICESGKEFKCFFTTETPCPNCSKKMQVLRNGKLHPFETAINSAPKLICNRGKIEMIVDFQTTNMFKKLRGKILKEGEDWDLAPMNNHYFCQPNTLLGSIVNDDRDPETFCINQRIMTIDFPSFQDLPKRRAKVDYRRIELSSNWRGYPIISQNCKKELLASLEKEGMTNTCRELIKVVVKRGPQYYGPFGKASINQENSQVFPEFLEQMILYWGNNMEENDPVNKWLVAVFKEFTMTIKAYLTSYEKWGMTEKNTPHNPVLLVLLKMKEDTGARGKCKSNYYYDPIRTYLCFMQYLFNFFLWGGQKMTPESRTKAFWKVARSKLEANCAVLFKEEDNQFESMEIRNIDHVYSYDLNLGGAPYSIMEVGDFYQSEEGNEESVELEESTLPYNPNSLGTTVYNAYLSPEHLDNVRGVICTSEELPLELTSLSKHSYRVCTRENSKNAVTNILSEVMGNEVGSNGEIVSEFSFTEDMSKKLAVILGTGNPKEITAAQAAYLFAPDKVRRYIDKLVKDKPNEFMLIFERNSIKRLEASISELLGEKHPEEMVRAKIGTHLFQNLVSGNYSIGQKTIDLEIQAELDKINPKILQLASTGKLQLTKNSRKVYETAINGLNIPGKKAAKVFFRLLLNECQTVPQPNRETSTTGTILDELFNDLLEWLENENKREQQLDNFDFVLGSSIDTIEDYTYTF